MADLRILSLEGRDRGITMDYLVLTLSGHLEDPLDAALLARHRAARSHFLLVVPTPRASPAGRALVHAEHLDARAGDGAGEGLARFRLRDAVRRLRRLGLDVDATLTDRAPVRALRDELRARRCDEVIVAGRPGGLLAWLGLDVTARTQRRLTVPVVRVPEVEGADPALGIRPLHV